MYDVDFYRALNSVRLRSAEGTVPRLLELLQPRSCVDVGCGEGVWLSVVHSLNPHVQILGVDGSHVRPDRLMIPTEDFRALDIGNPQDLLRLTGPFDLALCLEVAEHLPSSSAVSLVESLTRLGRVVAFSAAVPGQGGRHHVNEQWPAYWAKLFSACGYLSVDLVRPVIWNDPDIGYWYRQNLVLYAPEDVLPELESRADELWGRLPPLGAIHPESRSQVGPTRAAARMLVRSVARDLVLLYRRARAFGRS